MGAYGKPGYLMPTGKKASRRSAPSSWLWLLISKLTCNGYTIAIYPSCYIYIYIYVIAGCSRSYTHQFKTVIIRYPSYKLVHPRRHSRRATSNYNLVYTPAYPLEITPLRLVIDQCKAGLTGPILDLQSPKCWTILNDHINIHQPSWTINHLFSPFTNEPGNGACKCRSSSVSWSMATSVKWVVPSEKPICAAARDADVMWWASLVRCAF